MYISTDCRRKQNQFMEVHTVMALC